MDIYKKKYLQYKNKYLKLKYKNYGSSLDNKDTKTVDIYNLPRNQEIHYHNIYIINRKIISIKTKYIDTLYLIIGGTDWAKAHSWDNVFKKKNYLILDLLPEDKKNALKYNYEVQNTLYHVENKPTLFNWSELIKRYFKKIPIKIIVIIDWSTLSQITYCKEKIQPAYYISKNPCSFFTLNKSLPIDEGKTICFDDLNSFINTIAEIDNVKGYGIPYNHINAYKSEEEYNRYIDTIITDCMEEKNKPRLNNLITETSTFLAEQRKTYRISKSLFPKIENIKYFQNTSGTKKNVDWIIFTKEL